MQHENTIRTARFGLATFLLAGLFQGCGNDSSPGSFQPARETPNPVGAPPAAAPGALPSGGAEDVALEWDLPAGWSVLAPSMFRQANFLVPGNDGKKGGCYLSLLGGEAGGLEGNIARWRNQLGLAPLASADVAALPQAQMFGRDGVVVDFVGTWKGMSGTESEAGWRLVGVLQVDPGGSAFFKMYGPDALIAAEKEHFLALARSLRPAHAGHAAETAHGEVPPPAMNPNDPAAASMAGDQQGLAWMAPGTWTKGPDKAQRTVTYQTPGGGECYVTVIGGEAGGIGGNVNRWRDQLGCAALPAAELEKLEHLAFLGGDGRMVAIEGAGASAGKAMLGALVPLGARTVFVKLTGPAAAVTKETENFKAFAQSLKETK